MSLRPQAPPAVPEETRRIARAAFPKGTLCLRIDALGPVYQDSQFAALFSHRGRPAEAPGRLALAVVLQFAENLSDREAAEAVRGRIDWKYALGLALSDPGFDHTVLSEFRTRLARVVLNCCCSTPCWTAPRRRAWSRRAAASARTAPTCSRPCAR